MSAVIYDLLTGKVIGGDKPVQEQQKVFSRDMIIETLTEIVEMMEVQGYSFDGSILMLPSEDKAYPPVCVSMSPGATAQDMVNIMKPAYINLVKHAKLEEGVTNEPA